VSPSLALKARNSGAPSIHHWCYQLAPAVTRHMRNMKVVAVLY
jgi:hypothetical protein